MKDIKLKLADINGFIDGRNKVNSFATICEKKCARFCSDENNFYF